MADYIRVERGCPPWQPASDAILRHVLQRYTVPLCGVTVQDGVDYLFWCIIGQAEESNLWAYTHLAEPEAKRLLTADPQDVRGMLGEVTAERSCVIAYAAEDDDDDDDILEIVFSAHYEPGLVFGGDLQAAVNALKEAAKAEAERLEVARSDIEALAATDPQLRLSSV